jgi:hypothetical protein
MIENALLQNGLAALSLSHPARCRASVKGSGPLKFVQVRARTRTAKRHSLRNSPNRYLFFEVQMRGDHRSLNKISKGEQMRGALLNVDWFCIF